VSFEHVTKRYRAGFRHASLRSEIGRFGRRLRPGRSEPAPAKGLVAVEDLSFEVAEGDSFALIGANGAGKSTALRLISRITYPTEGRVRVRGRVGALIEVGSGVHPELTGRENIWLYGSILGISRNEIRRRFDDIVEFAELAPFIDLAVKHYSTGMQLRLGFSVAAFLEPNVFVIDEALSVGDANFQAKCVEHMTKLVRSGTTLLFVSHHLPAIESLCNRAILLERGHLVANGDTKDVLRTYIQRVAAQDIDVSADLSNQGTLRVTSARCLDSNGRERSHISPNEPLTIRLEFESGRSIERPHVVVSLTDGRPGALLECSMVDDGEAPASVPPRWTCDCVIPSLPLRPRMYEVWVDVLAADGYGRLVYSLLVTRFWVEAPLGQGPQSVVHASMGGAISVPYRWQITPG
jgi:ABC-type polysaccharide/polyol phosphate transport system ATPase subunit